MLGGYGEFMYQTGMIDELQRQYVVQQTDYGVKLIQQEKWVEAFQVRDVGCCLDLSKNVASFINVHTFLIVAIFTYMSALCVSETSCK